MPISIYYLWNYLLVIYYFMHAGSYNISVAAIGVIDLLQYKDAIGGVTVSSLTVEGHDIATTNVTFSQSIVGRGFNATINVTVTNQGHSLFNENC